MELEITAVELEITAVELEMKKKGPKPWRRRLTEGGGGKMGKKVDKEVSGWTAEGTEQQSGAGRP